MTKKLIVLTLPVLALALTANRAAACWVDIIPSYQFAYVPQTVICWRPETFYRDVDTVVEEPTFKTVTKRFNVTVLEEDFRDEEHQGTFYKFVPRTVEVDVLRVRCVPVPLTDPLTGKTVTVSRPEVYTERIKQVVMDRVAEKRKYTERVYFYKPVERVYEQDFVVREVHTKTVKVKQAFNRLVPYEATVLVPVYVPPGHP